MFLATHLLLCMLAASKWLSISPLCGILFDWIMSVLCRISKGGQQIICSIIYYIQFWETSRSMQKHMKLSWICNSIGSVTTLAVEKLIVSDGLQHISWIYPEGLTFYGIGCLSGGKWPCLWTPCIHHHYISLTMSMMSCGMPCILQTNAPINRAIRRLISSYL